MANGTLAIRIWSVTEASAATAKPVLESHDIRYFGGSDIRLYKGSTKVTTGEILHLRRIEFFNKNNSTEPEAAFDLVWDIPKNENMVEIRFDAGKRINFAEFEIQIPSVIAAGEKEALHTHYFEFWLDVSQIFDANGETRLIERTFLAEKRFALSQMELTEEGPGAKGKRTPVSKLLGFAEANAPGLETDALVPLLQEAATLSMLRFVGSDGRAILLAAIRRPLAKAGTWRIPYADGAAGDAGRPARLAYELPLDASWNALAQVQQPAAVSSAALKADDPLDWYVGLRHFTTRSILSMWNDVIALPYRSALQTVADPASLSSVPTLAANGGADRREWDILCPVHDELGTRNKPRDQQKLVRGNWPAVVHLSDAHELALPAVKVDVVGIFDHGGGNLSMDAALRGRREQAAKGGTVGPASGGTATAYVPDGASLFEFALVDLDSKWPARTTLRIGALDFELVKLQPDDRQWKIAAAILREVRPLAGPGREGIRMSAGAFLSVTSIRPAAQDPVPDEDRAPLGRSNDTELSSGGENARAIEARFEREPALVFLSTPDPGGSRDYTLTFSEVTEKDRSRNLTVQLTGPAADDPRPSKAIVIDRQPFIVAEVEIPPFGSRRSGLAGTEIANWEISEAEGRKWEIAGLEDGARISLPPQAVGEEMEKGDAFYQAFLPNERSNRPIGADDEFEQSFPKQPAASADGYVGRPVDYRFSPPSRVTIRTSYFDQRYVEAPWNLRRVLGYPGQRAPGAGVDSFDFELLYGLKGKAEDIPFLRLAEVESRLGAIPPRIPILSEAIGAPAGDPLKEELQEAYKKHWERWANATKAYRSRLGVLQLWAEGRVGELRLEKGIGYELVDFEAERARLPGSPEAAATVDPVIPIPVGASEAKNPPAIGTRRFFGGAEWGIESRNVLDAVRRDRHSTAGELRRPAFSALGGFGWLKAAFDNDLTRIYADVQLGRANFYSVERIGRIANLWHRAKHVIVYERTVVPSRQFRAQQPRHEGRPVVRKIQEYVELLEPVRRYPDGDGTTKRRGCLLGVEFKTRIIPVDGRWGYDVKEFGWAIPLWNPDSDPQVYPKPQVMFMGAPDPESGAPFVPGILDEPEKLLFFTETAAGSGPNTDAWAARPGIDYGDEPLRYPEYRDPNQVIDGEGPDRRLPDPPAIEGLERFTYRVNFGGRPVNLAAGRSQSVGGETREIAMSAVLENITFMRANPILPSATNPAAAAAFRLFAEPRDFGDGIARSKNHLGDGLASLDATLRSVVSQAAAGFQGAVTLDAMQKHLRKAFFGNEAGTGPLKTEIQNRLHGVEGQIRATLASVGQLDVDLAYGKVNEQCEALKDLPNTLLDQALRNLDARLASLESEIGSSVRQLTSQNEDLRREAFMLIDSGIGVAQAAVRPFSLGIDSFLGNIGDLRGEIDRVRAELAAEIAGLDRHAEVLIAEVESDFQKARQTARELRGRLAVARDRLAVSRDTARKALSKAVEGRFGKQARTALQAADEIFALATLALARADGVLEAIASAEAVDAEIVGALEDLRRNAQAGLSTIEAVANGWLTQASGVLQGFEQCIADLENLNDWAERLRGEVRAALANADLTPEALAQAAAGAIKNIRQEANATVTALKAKAAAPVAGLCNSLFDQLNAANALQDEFKAAISAFIDARLESFLGAAGSEIERSLDEVKDYIDSTIGAWRGQYDEFEDKFRNYVSEVNGEQLFQTGSAALRLIRGYGEGPILPQLAFNRDRLAYVFDDARDAILTSPAAAIVNDVGQVLNGLGLRVPTQELLDRLIPQDIEKTLVAKVTEHLAGIRFLNMFSGLKMPAVAKDAIQIRHGLDKATQSAWLNADLKMPFGPATLFDLGPLNLKLLAARLTAHARLTARLGQSPQQETFGELFGDWQLGFGGTKLVTFTRTAVSFDKSGDFKFDISPDRIQLDKAMEWLSDLVASWSDPDSGFLLELYEEGGRPRGVRAMLDLPVPAIAAGAFAMSGLRLTSFLALRYGTVPAIGNDFIVEAGASLGRRDAPFALTVYFLRGGGWLEAKALYATSSGRLSVAVTIGIIVGAGAEINFGPVNGSVSLEIGIFVEFYKNIGGGQGFSIGLMLLIRGRVMVIQIVSVCLTLMLSLTYTPGDKSMVGRGYLSITVKISRFFKYSVRQNVQYKLK